MLVGKLEVKIDLWKRLIVELEKLVSWGGQVGAWIGTHAGRGMNLPTRWGWVVCALWARRLEIDLSASDPDV